MVISVLSGSFNFREYIEEFKCVLVIILMEQPSKEHLEIHIFLFIDL